MYQSKGKGKFLKYKVVESSVVMGQTFLMV